MSTRGRRFNVRGSSRSLKSRLLKVPRVLLARMQEWASAVLCEYLKGAYPNDLDIQRLPCPKGRGATYSRLFRVEADDFRGWPYLRIVEKFKRGVVDSLQAGEDFYKGGAFHRMLRAPVEEWTVVLAASGPTQNAYTALSLEYIKVTLDFQSTKGVAGGWFSRNKQMAHIYVSGSSAGPRHSSKEPPALDEIHAWQKALEDVVEHELTHYTQHLLNQILEKNGVAGRPSQKIRTPNIRQPDFQNMGLEEQTLETERVHALDDVEFYTRLSDEIKLFNRGHADKHSPTENGYEAWDRARKSWVGLLANRGRLFFVTLRDRAHLKWRKALKEFMVGTDQSSPDFKPAPRLPSLRPRTHSYEGADPAILRVLDDVDGQIALSIRQFRENLASGTAQYKAERIRKEKINLDLVARGRAPRDLDDLLDYINPVVQFEPARLRWVGQEVKSIPIFGDIVIDTDLIFKSLRDYAPDRYGAAVREFMRQTDPLALRVASRFFQSVKDPHLEYYGLDALLKGESMRLYHGTTAKFRRFDMSRSRTDLVDRFYGAGIFLTPRKSVAGQYADANRNIGFPPEIIDDLKRINPAAGSFLHDLYTLGLKKTWGIRVHDVEDPAAAFEELEASLKGVDVNTLQDIVGYIIGAAKDPVDPDEGFFDIFSTSTGLDSYVYDSLDEVGLDSFKYRPKIYTVKVKVENPLVTASKAGARRARAMGYDSVIYHGSDLVDDVPEVAVFDPRKVSIVKVEAW